MDLHPTRLRFVIRVVVPLLVSALAGGCVSTDLLRGAEREFQRALRQERVGAFFEPVLASVRGDVAPPIPPVARQHYLGVVANLELVGPTGKQELRRGGTLGAAMSLKLLAQWRLGRLDQARESWRELRGSHQDSPDQRVRALVAAFDGVVRLEDALAALRAGQPFEEMARLILGDDGVWRALGAARMESARTGATPPELLEARLAAFKVLKDAYDRVPPASPLSDEQQLVWKRARAEAQIELAEFASLQSPEVAGHRQKVMLWQSLCGLEAPPR